jgi:hypothetical protein
VVLGLGEGSIHVRLERQARVVVWSIAQIGHGDCVAERC